MSKGFGLRRVGARHLRLTTERSRFRTSPEMIRLSVVLYVGFSLLLLKGQHQTHPVGAWLRSRLERKPAIWGASRSKVFW